MRTLLTLFLGVFFFHLHASPLFEESQWQNLLAYQNKKSIATKSNFYISPEGRINPEAELNATIKAFQENPDKYICEFPARYKWLKEKLAEKILDFDIKQKCTELNVFKEQLNAKSVSLIFSSYYLNSPASAFGHTLMKFNLHDSSEQSNELLDRAINFSATVTTSNALVYAVLGMVGGFKGEFSMLPYFYKLREYNDFESRDIWNYELNLTKDEIDFMVMHLWELRLAKFNYYYFSKNCSYFMLALLDVARPSLNLIKQSKTFIIPGDTIKTMMESKGLLNKITFRPSMRKKLLVKISSLSLNEKKVFENPNDLSTLSKEQQAKVLDTLIESFDYKNTYEVLTNNENTSKKKQEMLEQRANLGIASKQSSYDIPWSEAPHNAHGSMRLNYKATYNDQYHLINEIGLRFALHDLLDPSEGYAPNSEIEFGNIKLEQFSKNNKNYFALNKFDLVNVMSLNPFESYEKKYSWNFKTGVETLSHLGARLHYNTYLQVGAGYYFALNSRLHFGSLFFIKPEFSTYFAKGYSLAVSPELFFRYNDSHLRSKLSLNLMHSLFNNNYDLYQVSFDNNINLTKNLSLNLGMKKSNIQDEYSIGLSLYR